MSQKKVTEFFSNRKRGVESHHASKRIKVAPETNVLDESGTTTSKKSCVMRSQIVPDKNEEVLGENPKVIKGIVKPPVKSRAVSKKKIAIDKPASQMTKYLQKSSPTQNNETQKAILDDVLLKDSEPISTSFIDDHGASPASSPVKRQTSDSQMCSSDSFKRGRNNETVSMEDVYKTPDKFDFSPYAASSELSTSRIQLSSARKKLNLQPGSVSPVYDFKGTTPEKQPPISRVTTPVKASPNESPGKIGRCSNLSELKEKLAQFTGRQVKAENALERARLSLEKRNQEKSKSIAESKDEPTNSAGDKPQQSSVSQAPAYERHSSLAVVGPPPFLLPYQYRILKDTFQNTDTIVSMLTNRSEICTFNKLKVAVQEMSKRTFELSHLGQIKTVYPTAYHFRQEKDLPIFGGKASGYQLTVEPILNESNAVNNTDNRMTFTATKLLERKNTFLHNLVNIVKKFHREFLKQLGVDVNESDIKRWHPKFKLDSVPDVEPSELPQAPLIKTFSTAKDVLDEVKDKLNPRVQKALEAVANKTSNSPVKPDSTEAGQPNNDSLPEKSQSSTSNVADRLNSFRGIPSSLLERVRAKQAHKLEREMTRSTEVTKRVEMLQRLPELTRILRTHFVTQKRPAIPLVDVIKTFSNSYKSKLGMVEAEQHVKLIAEVVPEWMTIVHIKSGSFVKIDRDVDLMSVHGKIQDLIKSL